MKIFNPFAWLISWLFRKPVNAIAPVAFNGAENDYDKDPEVIQARKELRPSKWLPMHYQAEGFEGPKFYGRSKKWKYINHSKK